MDPNHSRWRELIDQECSNGKKLYLPVASDGLDVAIVTTKGNVESNDSVASLNEVQVLLRDVSLGGSAVEEELDLLEEAGFLELIKLGTEVLGINSSCLGEESGLYTKGKECVPVEGIHCLNRLNSDWATYRAVTYECWAVLQPAASCWIGWSFAFPVVFGVCTSGLSESILYLYYIY